MASTRRARTFASLPERARAGGRALAALATLVVLFAPAPLAAQRVARDPHIDMDSVTAATMRRRQSRERSDTVRAFPIRRLAEGVYAVVGDTGRGSEGRSNAGFIVTDDGVVVIDALASPAQGRALVRTIRTVTSAPIRWLILTHHHPDHTFGAIVLKRAGARIIAHPDRRTLASDNGEDAMVSDWTGAIGLREMQGFVLADTPDVPVARDTILHIGGRTLAIHAPGAAHTPGDLAIWLPDARVLFAGDLLVEDGVTMMVDGNSLVLLAALDWIAQLHPRTVVPGHGRIPDDPATLVRTTRCYVLALRATMREAVAQGTPMSRTLDALPPADRDRPISLHSRIRRNAVRVYAEMERELLQAPDSAALAAESRARAACPQ